MNIKPCWAILAVLLCSCTKEAQEHSTTSNSEFKVELLFRHDGCEVFRFEDGGRDHYYVRCKSDDIVTAIEQHSESRGKTTHTVQDEVHTVTGRR
jgi:hypothetical protein